ncbi:DNA double-strand break repair Rad50 ATPase [Acrasis kona]|uniref:DNA double-strand break repair Rad50 ATPase n=1 Tax=Acrasis kona TaxID=1008807 RepID=A0AAW2Z3D4_9EUKA
MERQEALQILRERILDIKDRNVDAEDNNQTFALLMNKLNDSSEIQNDHEATSELQQKCNQLEEMVSRYEQQMSEAKSALEEKSNTLKKLLTSNLTNLEALSKREKELEGHLTEYESYIETLQQQIEVQEQTHEELSIQNEELNRAREETHQIQLQDVCSQCIKSRTRFPESMLHKIFEYLGTSSQLLRDVSQVSRSWSFVARFMIENDTIRDINEEFPSPEQTQKQNIRKLDLSQIGATITNNIEEFDFEDDLPNIISKEAVDVLRFDSFEDDNLDGGPDIDSPESLGSRNEYSIIDVLTI